MGYTKIVQYGDVTEVYQYEKNLSNTPRPPVSPTAKKRAKTILDYKKAKGIYRRTDRSITRSRNNFFRLVHHNNVLADTIHFLTITFANDAFAIKISYKTASRHISKFMEKLKRDTPEVSLRYISVPELTKKGNYHFHLLVYNLPTEKVRNERKTRYYQRQFQRGYLDFRLAKFRSKGLAGYLAKYMGKALGDTKNEAWRGYNCSRNIIKINSIGSNALDQEIESLVIPNEGTIQKRSYPVPYLGTCTYKKITK